MELRYKINAKILLLAMLGAIMVCASYLIFVYEPLQMIIRKVLSLTPGSIMYNIWTKPPYEVYIKIFIFNVTNPQEFLDGKERLRVNEIGPYVYKEMLFHTESHFNDNGSLTFQPIRTLEFIRERSVGDVKNDYLISPNIPLIGITAALQNSSMFVNLAVSSISSYLGSQSFLNLSVNEYLWGYDDPLVELANGVVPNWIDFPRFGILDRLMALDNSTNMITISATPDAKVPDSDILSEEELRKPYIIQRWNGSPGLPQWGYQEPVGNETVEGNSRCNTLLGSSDGSIYPRNLNTTVRLYRRAFCRPVYINYHSEYITKDGIRGHAFRVSNDFLATPEENPENSCYCVKGNCPAKGVGHLSPCYYGIPVTISQPHFLNSDPILLEKVEGLSPDPDKHDINIILHPEMGVPLEAKVRIQINLSVDNTKYNSKTKPFNQHTLPLFWLELSIDEVPKSIYIYILLLFHILPVVMQVLIYVLCIAGLSLIMGCALVLLYFPRTPACSMFRWRSDYSPIPIIPMAQQYFRPDVRISK